MKTVKIKFVSPINIDNGYTNTYLGDYESEMELFIDENDCPMMIEWIVEDIDAVEHIGLEYDKETNEVTGYDGVFEIPKEAIQLLEEQGYNCEQIKEYYD